MVRVDIVEWHNHKFMFIDGYLWMWDTPQERRLQKKLADMAFGDVLVVGYGLGLIIEFLLKNPNVKSITVVEKYKEVIDKARELGFYRDGVSVIISDFFELPENNKYDCVIGDIWPDIDPEFLPIYVEFKNKAQKLLRNGGMVLAWGEEFFEFLLENEKRDDANS